MDARQFLEAAKLLDAPHVIATNAIHVAIAAADAITCHALGERSNDGNHVSAVDLLRKVEASLATALKRALDRKTQAGYESTDISSADAASQLAELLRGGRRQLRLRGRLQPRSRRAVSQTTFRQRSSPPRANIRRHQPSSGWQADQQREHARIVPFQQGRPAPQAKRH